MQTEQLLAEDRAARAAALDPVTSFIVRAPAGSGKTELLTQRYLALLAGVDEPEEIVAITFTRKAAGEMRARIVRALVLGAGSAPAEEHRRVTWELARRAQTRDQERSWHLKDHPARMRIQTIDSLNAELTRQMPLLAGFGAQPRTNERPRVMYTEAARRTLQLLEEGDAAQSAAVAELARHLDNDLPRIQELLSRMLPRRDQWLRVVQSGANRRVELETNLAREICAHLRQLRAAIPADCVLELMELAALAGARLHGQGSDSDIVNCATLASLPGAESEALPAWYGLAELLLTKDGEWRRTLNKNQGLPPEEKPAKTRLMELLRRLGEDETLRRALATVSKLPSPRYAEPQWRALQALLELLPLAAAQLQLVFAERGEVDFPEVALSALRALGAPERPSDLALALDYSIRHLLVDEFQDTAVNQIRLLELLTAGWQPDDGHSLFLVGDPMQSIYRFREAEVGLFLDAWERGLGSLSLQPLTLRLNFRSQMGLVDWFNGTFQRILPLQPDVASGAVPYAECAAAYPPHAGAAVTVHALFDSVREREAALVMQLIATAHAERPDAKVAVLVRAKTHLATLLRALRALRARGVHFQAMEIEALWEQPVVQDLLALTRALAHPADRSAWLAVLRAPWCGLTLEELHRLAGSDHAAMLPTLLQADAAGLAASPGLARTCGTLLHALQQTGRGSLRQQVESTWLRLGGPAALRGAEALTDAEAYFELLEQLDQGGVFESGAELERQLAELFARPDPEADGGLQLMTIHKAKGLEFDTVIVPGLDAVTRGNERDLLVWIERPREHGRADLLLAPLNATGHDNDPVYQWLTALRQQQQTLEAGRLLYVAATRARERLHLIGGTSIKFEDSAANLLPPRSGSLLALLWPTVETTFAQALRARSPAGEATAAVSPTAAAQTLHRLRPDWRPPAATTAVSALPAGPAQAAEHEAPEFVWAGETLRHVGSVVHRLLQAIAEDGIDTWDMARLTRQVPLIRQLLAQAGVTEEARAAALEDVQMAVRNTLKDPRGRWLFAADHQDARSEYALSSFEDGRLSTGIIDRSFVDVEGVRWVVDYKTSRHAGTDVDAFLARERERYAPQLQRYASLLRGLEKRRVKVALYFPLLQRFLEWEPVDGPES
jgi:ATP-dependent exoDNAse (exonuclease V) beta subunit